MPDYQEHSFETSAAWRDWLTNHHDNTDGIWLRLYKKSSGINGISYAEALDEPLCFGWIDGQSKKGNDEYYFQKFTPRRARSLWSRRNVEYIERLEKADKMMPAGKAEVEQARADGRLAAAYDKPSDMTVPDNFLAELAKHPKANAFFATLNKTNTYAIAWRLKTAKTEATRQRRQDKLLAMLEAEQKLH